MARWDCVWKCRLQWAQWEKPKYPEKQCPLVHKLHVGANPGLHWVVTIFLRREVPIVLRNWKWGEQYDHKFQCAWEGLRYQWQTVPFSAAGIWHTTVTLLSHCWRVKIGLLKGIKAFVGNFTFRMVVFSLNTLHRFKASVVSERKRVVAWKCSPSDRKLNA